MHFILYSSGKYTSIETLLMTNEILQKYYPNLLSLAPPIPVPLPPSIFLDPIIGEFLFPNQQTLIFFENIVTDFKLKSIFSKTTSYDQLVLLHKKLQFAFELRLKIASEDVCINSIRSNYELA
jgi:hypothetical protein